MVTKRPIVQGSENLGVKWSDDAGWNVCIFIDLYLCSCL